MKDFEVRFRDWRLRQLLLNVSEHLQGADIPELALVFAAAVYVHRW